MATKASTEAPAHEIVKRIGYAGLAHLVQINIAASNAIAIANAASTGASQLRCGYPTKAHVSVRNSTGTISTECAGIVGSYKAFLAADNYVQFPAHFIDVVKRNERAVVTANSLALLVTQNEREILYEMGGHDVILRCNNVVNLITSVVEARIEVEKAMMAAETEVTKD